MVVCGRCRGKRRIGNIVCPLCRGRGTLLAPAPRASAEKSDSKQRDLKAEAQGDSGLEAPRDRGGV